MATAGTANLVDAVDDEFFVDTLGASQVLVHCVSGTAKIHVAGLHASGEYFPIAAGTSVEFFSASFGIKKIIGQGGGGAAVINFGVTAK